jgi:hypothetical protein
MAENLRFVPSLGTSFETHPRFESVQPGTHTDCILKESVRPFGRYGEANTDPRSLGSYVLATSFPDILPTNGQTVLTHAAAIFTRSEFFALRAIGDRESKLPLQGQAADKFAHVVSNVSAASPGIIYHRLLDYNPDEFTFLQSRKGIGLRGSGRLLTDPALLIHELEVVRQLQANGQEVRVILPFVVNPDEQERIQAIVRDQVNPSQIGSMVERVEHAQHIKDYPTVNFVFPGPSDLTSDYHKKSRGEYRDGDSAERFIIDLAQTLARDAAAAGIAEMLAIKILVGSIAPEHNQTITNVYMPNQLLSQY